MVGKLEAPGKQVSNSNQKRASLLGESGSKSVGQSWAFKRQGSLEISWDQPPFGVLTGAKTQLRSWKKRAVLNKCGKGKVVKKYGELVLAVAAISNSFLFTSQQHKERINHFRWKYRWFASMHIHQVDKETLQYVNRKLKSEANVEESGKKQGLPCRQRVNHESQLLGL